MIISPIRNVSISPFAWAQATLPVKDNGLGIRSANFLAPSAFLSSVSATEDLIHCILPSCFGFLKPFLWPLPFLVGLSVMIFHPAFSSIFSSECLGHLLGDEGSRQPP